MDDYQPKPNGELNGFDSVNGNGTPNREEGYTVMPDGGFYTKSRNEIIQDEVSEPRPTEPVQPEQPPIRPEMPRDAFAHGEGSGPVPAYGSYGYPPVRKKKKQTKQKRYGAGVVAVASVLAAFIGAGSGIAVMLSKTETPAALNPPVSGNSQVNINIDKEAETVVEAVAEKASPSVVGIRTTTSVTSFFGGKNEQTGEGSGVVYSSDGYIITNYHVISGAVTNKSGSKIEVFTESASADSYEASVVGYNISSDLAVLKINAAGLVAVEFADSSQLKVGQYVITIGNPGGLEFMDSVTYGVVSGLNRVVSANSSVSLIQTDAAINPGNSGGALLNTKGQLVGINSSKIVSEEFEGMGFAIPANTVLELCVKIIERQNKPEPYVGITVSEKYTEQVLKYYGYPAGAVVLSVAEDSPAEKSGLAKGDIITEFNGTEVKEYTMLSDLIKDCKPKQEVSVKLYRGGRYYTTTITVGADNAVE